jgi:hypothetical protein
MNNDSIKVKSVLKDLVAPKDLQLRDLPETNLPLFLLAELGPDLVAFAAINGKSEEDYGRALDIFKDLYADSGDAWADRDLTLSYALVSTMQDSVHIGIESSLIGIFAANLSLKWAAMSSTNYDVCHLSPSIPNVWRGWYGH